MIGRSWNRLAVLATSLSLATGISAAQTENTAYDRIIGHYEKIRLLLLHDSTSSVAEHAIDIANIAAQLEQEFDPTEAAVAPSNRAECLRLLADIKTVARELSEATLIGGMREKFGALSAAMVHYHEMTGRKNRLVVFCPMLNQVWLQPAGEIGNPYYGTSMARCGEIVSD